MSYIYKDGIYVNINTTCFPTEYPATSMWACVKMVLQSYIEDENPKYIKEIETIKSILCQRKWMKMMKIG